MDRQITRPQLNAELNMDIHNRFDIEVIDSRTGKVRQRAQAQNVICDIMWTNLLDSTSANQLWANYLHYGTGAGTPTAADTTLFNTAGYLAKDSWVVTSRIPDGVYSCTHKYIMLETVAAGSLLTEVGLSYSNSLTGNVLCTHAMLKDMNGNPISIQKTDTDIINFYATVFLYFPPELNGYMGFVRSPGLFRWACGSAYVPSSAPAILSGASSSASNSRGSYSRDAQAKTLTYTAGRFAASEGNGTEGFKVVSLHSSDLGISFLIDDSWYTPAMIIGEAIGTGDGATKDFTTQFRDISELTVYVDGVAVPATSTPTLPILQPANALYYCPESFALDGRRIATASLSNYGDGIIVAKPGGDELGWSSIRTSVSSTSSSPSYRYITISVSNDREDWVVLAENVLAQTVTIPEAYRYYKYLRVGNQPATESRVNLQTFANLAFYVPDNTNIHLETPPAEGAVITADYRPGVIAKDENHVFDFSLTIHLGEYTE